MWLQKDRVLGIPLAAGCYVAAFGWELNPIFGAVAMGLSSFCVVSNALRLNWIKPYDSARDKVFMNPVNGILIEKEYSSDRKETNEMKITVNGMMCGHCEARVKKALEAVPDVESAVCDHTAGTAVVTLSGDVSDEALTAAVEAQDYKVLEVE